MFIVEKQILAVGSDYSNTYNLGFVFLDVMEPYAALCIERMFSRLNASAESVFPWQAFGNML
jgi:hypothetical protein